jgi:hypothetical protein
MKKKIVCIGITLAAVSMILAGCGKNKSLSIKVDTGDTIDISVDKSGGYSLEKTDDKSFSINCKGNKLSTGSFVTADYYADYADSLNTDESVDVLSTGQNDYVKYVFYRCDDKYDYIVLINDSDTGVLIENTTSELSAQKCFRHLRLKVSE